MKTCLISILSVLTLAAVTGAQSHSVSGALDQLVVGAEDLPLTFSMAGSNDEGPGEHAAIFFRPEVLAAESMTEGSILGVMVHLEVAANTASASDRFNQNRNAEAISSALGPGSGSQGFLNVKELDEAIAGADASLGFRVEYQLEGVHLVEYRYRLRVANAVVNLMVSGRASDQGLEPPALAGQASHIALRQASRLALSEG